ncbi:MAG TPA: rhomboid family intramembrane serine protease [Gammaproteobacteria bacterium]|jgi:membrane associated rhomboid family serine protease|nr:rhomboid family intramembrane serine protease [Gammaproteobacteria bacterium]
MFFFPFSDDNPTKNRPYVTYFLIGICCFIFLWQFTLPPQLFESSVYNFGVVPASLLGSKEGYLPATMTIFTSMFMHGGWMHLIGNMLFLWIFGDNVEDSMGRIKFIIFYLLAGIAAAYTQAFIDPSSEIPMIGASGAIAGVLGAYLLLHPKANVNVLLWIIIFITVIRVPASIVLGFWIISQFFYFGLSTGGEGGVAYFAHIGGFIAGMALIPFFKNAEIPLWEQSQTKAFETRDFDLQELIPGNKVDGFMEDFIKDADERKKH